MRLETKGLMPGNPTQQEQELKRGGTYVDYIERFNLGMTGGGAGSASPLLSVIGEITADRLGYCFFVCKDAIEI